jgi:hypothetical protein
VKSEVLGGLDAVVTTGAHAGVAVTLVKNGNDIGCSRQVNRVPRQHGWSVGSSGSVLLMQRARMSSQTRAMARGPV